MDRISDDELAYMKKVLAEVQGAAVLQQFLAHYLQGKYGLADADSIRDDGTIVRASDVKPSNAR